MDQNPYVKFAGAAARTARAAGVLAIISVVIGWPLELDWLKSVAIGECLFSVACSAAAIVTMLGVFLNLRRRERD